MNILVYYAQAWAFAKLGHGIFNEEVEAWDDGPVVPSVYHAFKKYGKIPFRNQRIPTPPINLQQKR
ncbi:MAG TPA: Panacea domain-containing protein [Methanocorpusculum sp.]|nr:Panacea domain-containing protein [Methanocorpusculum sp.]